MNGIHSAAAAVADCLTPSDNVVVLVVVVLVVALVCHTKQCSTYKQTERER